MMDVLLSNILPNSIDIIDMCLPACLWRTGLVYGPKQTVSSSYLLKSLHEHNTSHCTMADPSFRLLHSSEFILNLNLE